MIHETAAIPAYGGVFSICFRDLEYLIIDGFSVE